MIVLVGCEYSARVRDSFRAMGCDAWSCDLLPCEGDPRWHLQCDVFEAIRMLRPALGIFHPPCTDLAVSGSRHFPEKIADGRQARALDFVQALMASKIEKIAIENPISVISSKIRKPDQIIQPWQFGHPEQKKTCLWLKNLPKLKPTNDVSAYMRTLPERERARVHHMTPGPNRWRERSRTYSGIAAAMAMQWTYP